MDKNSKNVSLEVAVRDFFTAMAISHAANQTPIFEWAEHLPVRTFRAYFVLPGDYGIWFNYDVVLNSWVPGTVV